MIKKINSKKKGSRGELELSKTLTEAGFPARRGQQFQGTSESPDIICESLSDYHIECKRTERGNPYNWLQQATDDAPDKIPLVIHRRSDKQWIAVMNLDDLLSLLFKSMNN